MKAPEHFRPVPGARVVSTRALADACEAVRTLVSEFGLGAFHGEGGYGKTFTTECALALECPLEVVSLKFARPTTQRRVVSQLLDTATGVRHKGELYTLLDEALYELSLKPRFVFIDEAQDLNTAAIEVLRYLHDDPTTQFALLLVGGDDCWQRLSSFPMLHSRLIRAVEFAPLQRADLFDYLPRFHPVYANADRKGARAD